MPVGQSAAATQRFTPAKLIEALEAGLPFQELPILQASLAVNADRLAPMPGISDATFHRNKGAANRLNPAVPDRVLRYARLLGFAAKVFGNLEDAKQWLNAPQFGLGGAVPLEYAKTELGAREVENLGPHSIRRLFMIRPGWRIVPEELAVSAFEGEGARLFGGRWNSAGLPMVYAAEHLSLAALEVRVHIDRTSLRKRYRCLSFEFDQRLMKVLPAKSLPKHWQQEPPPRFL